MVRLISLLEFPPKMRHCTTAPVSAPEAFITVIIEDRIRTSDGGSGEESLENILLRVFPKRESVTPVTPGRAVIFQSRKSDAVTSQTNVRLSPGQVCSFIRRRVTEGDRKLGKQRMNNDKHSNIGT